MANKAEWVSGFQPSTEVENTELLFGHNRSGALLDELATQIRLGTNCQLLGERRSGKSSVLRCTAQKLVDLSPALLPVYANAREYHTVRGYSDAYRWILAVTCQAAARFGVRGVEEELQNRIGGTLLPDMSVMELVDAFRAIGSNRLEGALESTLESVAQEGFGVVLLFDEYEHFMEHTLEAKEGAFFHLRKLSSKAPSSPNVPKPLTYVIAGAQPWDELCKKIGSPELNNVGAVLYVTPLDQPALDAMWSDCLTRSSDDVCQRVQQGQRSLPAVWDLAGGWAFYGKVIGQHLSASNPTSDSLYEALIQHFNVIWARLDDAERRVLSASASKPVTTDDATVRNLKRRGLMRSEAGVFEPLGTLWKRFCSETGAPTERPATSSRQAATDLRQSVEEVVALVAEINENWQLLTGTEMFVCSNGDTHIYNDLRAEAASRDQFTHFSLSLYNLVFERTVALKATKSGAGDVTARPKTLERLPRDFRRNLYFVRAVAAVRHHFGKGHMVSLDTFNSEKGGMPIGDVLSHYTAAKTIPTGAQFASFQMALLRDLQAFLQDLLAFTRTRANSDSSPST